MKTYVIIYGIGGYRLLPYKTYKKSKLLQCHEIIDIGTKKQLRKYWEAEE